MGRLPKSNVTRYKISGWQLSSCDSNPTGTTCKNRFSGFLAVPANGRSGRGLHRIPVQQSANARQLEQEIGNPVDADVPSSPKASPASPPFIGRLNWAVPFHAMLTASGQVLTTGAFLTYFVQEAGARGLWLAVFAALPETIGIVALATRLLLIRFPRPGRLWLLASIPGRIAVTLFPCVVLIGPESWRLPLLAALLIVSSACHAIAAASLQTWLTELVPTGEWNRFFARRNIASLAIDLVLPVSVAVLRDSWRKSSAGSADVFGPYCAIFLAGSALLWLAVLPLCGLPEARCDGSAETHRPQAPTANSLPSKSLGTLLGEPEWRRVLAYSWVLGAAQGLTQAVFQQYLYRELKLGLTEVYVLRDVMLIGQLGLTYWAGHRLAAWGYRPTLSVCTLLTTLALPLWCLATPTTWWWLLAAYALWSAFGPINLAGPNLVSRMAAPFDRAGAYAAFRNGSGLLAGVTGLIGGFWLDQLLTGNGPLDPAATRTAYFLIFFTSFVGRLLAAALAARIREPEAIETDS